MITDQTENQTFYQVNFKNSSISKTELIKTKHNLTKHSFLLTYQNDKNLRGRKTDLFGLLACAGKP